MGVRGKAFREKFIKKINTGPPIDPELTYGVDWKMSAKSHSAILALHRSFQIVGWDGTGIDAGAPINKVMNKLHLPYLDSGDDYIQTKFIMTGCEFIALWTMLGLMMDNASVPEDIAMELEGWLMNAFDHLELIS